MINKSCLWMKVIISCFFTVFFQMNIDMNCMPMESFYSEDITKEIGLLIIFYCSFKIWENSKSSAYKRCALAVGSLLALFYVLGYNIDRYQDLFTEYNYEWMLEKLFLKWIVCGYCFSTIILFVYSKLEKIKYKNMSKINQIPKAVRQFILVLFFVVCWIPFVINNLPGVLYGDSWNQIYQALGIEELSTHHPLTHTMLVKLCLNIFQDAEKGILLYTIISLVVIIGVLSYTINLMIDEKFDIRIIMLAILIYVFFPPMPLFTIAVMKDGWFAAFVGMFLMEIYIVMVAGKNNTRYLLGLGLSATGICLFRKNGIYLLIFVCIYLLFDIIIKKNKSKKVLMICVLAISISAGVERVGIELGVSKGSPREMLSLPIQQMARIEKNIENLDMAIESEINSFFKKGSNLGEIYYPLISDNAKSEFNTEGFSGREKEFLKLSLRLLFLYPEESLEAFMCNSYGYWYPTAINWFYAENNDKELDITETIKKHLYPDSVRYEYYNEYKYTVGLTLISSLGMVFWFYFAISGYLFATKKYKKLILMAPLCALWLTSIASPVWNELRYVLAIYPALPVICQLVIPTSCIMCDE